MTQPLCLLQLMLGKAPPMLRVRRCLVLRALAGGAADPLAVLARAPVASLLATTPPSGAGLLSQAALLVGQHHTATSLLRMLPPMAAVSWSQGD